MAPVTRYVRVVTAAVFAAAVSVTAYAGHDYQEPVDFTAAEQVKRLLDIGENVIFIDLRAAEDFAKGHLPTARSIPIAVLDQRWKEIPTSGRVVLYCACPSKEGDETADETYAFLLLRQEKYRNISFLKDSYAEWVKRGYPIETASR